MRLWLALFLLLGVSRVEAAETENVVSLFEGTSQEGKIDSPEEKKEDSGIFSFLNFGKIKKDAPKITVADEKRLSPLEQSVKLADGGDVNAQLLVGYSYLYGQNGAKVDYDKAFEYYARAAMQNDNVGLNNLGSLYYSGIGVARNTAKAAILFEKAAALGNAEAAVNLGFILISGNGVEKNPAEAMNLFEKASSAENVPARFMYGYALYTGKLRAQNFAAAAPLIRKAADAGFDEAQYVVALMYINGLGFPQHYGNAVKYLRRAAEQGNVEAMMTLGDIYARGEKYKKDVYLAHIFFNLAAVRGAPKAAEKRSVLEEKMKIEEVLQAQTEAENFREKVSEMTSYIRQTFGGNIRSFIDEIR